MPADTPAVVRNLPSSTHRARPTSTPRLSNMLWRLVDADTGKVNHDIDWTFRVGDRVQLPGDPRGRGGRRVTAAKGSAGQHVVQRDVVQRRRHDHHHMPHLVVTEHLGERVRHAGRQHDRAERVDDASDA
jgi:hypothetical protein